MVEGLATVGFRDAATILHGGGAMKLHPELAARRLLDGVLRALAVVPGAESLRELTVVELVADRLPSIRRGLEAARASTNTHVYIEDDELPPLGPAPAAPTPPGSIPQHLRLGITRSGSDLKVTVIGEESYDSAGDCEYPGDAAQKLLTDASDLLQERDDRRRLELMKAIGHRLWEAFLAPIQLDIAGRLERNLDRYLVLRFDASTVDLPWELLFDGDGFVSRRQLMARQLEIKAPGRPVALAAGRRRLRVLVVGNPTRDLPGSASEAQLVAGRLKELGAEVNLFCDGVSYADVSRELDTLDYDVLHYAGHATYDESREGAGGLLLADGQVLTADDLSIRRNLPRLFFANGCRSAQTGTELSADPARATRDLVHGLLRAGVRAFIGSMWEVDDAAGETFATGFYDKLAGQGEEASAPVGEAVRAAREAVVAAHGEHEPAWAGYALYGSPWRPAL
jgi:CHAT domain-containing protein